jgi:AhpD family alkylhydroperoxidase
MDTTTAERRERVSLMGEARDAYRAMAEFDRSIDLDPALRELVKIRASQLNGCAYCIDMHTRVARKAGESSATAWHTTGPSTMSRVRREKPPSFGSTRCCTPPPPLSSSLVVSAAGGLARHATPYPRTAQSTHTKAHNPTA